MITRPKSSCPTFARKPARFTRLLTGVNRKQQEEEPGNRLTQQLYDLSQMGKDLNNLKKLQKQSKEQINLLKQRGSAGLLLGELRFRHSQKGRPLDEEKLISKLTDQQKDLLVSAKMLTSKRAGKLIRSSLNQYAGNSADSDDSCGPKTGALIGGLNKKSSCLDISISSDSGKQDKQEKEDQSQSQLQMVKEGLRACKGDKGVFNPMAAFERLNEIAKKQDPEAYQPEIQIAIEKKQQRERDILERHRLLKEEKVKFALEQEKTLFDFDEEIDQLEDVQDRYPAKNKITEPESEPIAPDGTSAGKVPGEFSVAEPKILDREAVREKRQIEFAKKFGIQRAVRPALPANVLEDLKKVKGETPTAPDSQTTTHQASLPPPTAQVAEVLKKSAQNDLKRMNRVSSSKQKPLEGRNQPPPPEALHSPEAAYSGYPKPPPSSVVPWKQLLKPNRHTRTQINHTSSIPKEITSNMSTFKRTVSIEVDKGIEQIMAVGGLKKSKALDSSRGSATIIENDKRSLRKQSSSKHRPQITESHSKKKLSYQQASKVVDSGQTAIRTGFRKVKSTFKKEPKPRFGDQWFQHLRNPSNERPRGLNRQKNSFQGFKPPPADISLIPPHFLNEFSPKNAPVHRYNASMQFSMAERAATSHHSKRAHNWKIDYQSNGLPKKQSSKRLNNFINDHTRAVHDSLQSGAGQGQINESANFSLLGSVEKESSLERPTSMGHHPQNSQQQQEVQRHYLKRPPRNTIRTHHRIQQFAKQELQLQQAHPREEKQPEVQPATTVQNEKKLINFNQLDYADRITQRPAIISQSHSFRTNQDFRMSAKSRVTPTAGVQHSLSAANSIHLGSTCPGGFRSRMNKMWNQVSLSVSHKSKQKVMISAGGKNFKVEGDNPYSQVPAEIRLERRKMTNNNIFV